MLKQKEIIKPVFDKEYVAFTCSSSNEYVPYLSVLLKSIAMNADKNFNYDLIVLEYSITDENKKLLKENIETENISLRFFNPKKYFEGIKLHVSRAQFKEETYFRVLIPQIMPDYEKVIFTDCDLIFDADIKGLINIDLNNNVIASVIEPAWEFFLNTGHKEFGVGIEDYTKNILKLKNPTKYFNTGVILYNIAKCNEEKFTDTLLENITTYNYWYHEQDMITSLFNDKIYKLPFAWNYEILINYVFTKISDETRKYIKVDNPKVIHWIGPEKPWYYPDKKYAYRWWNYARQTPYYELILNNMTDFKIKQANNNLIKDLIQYPKILFNYTKYRFLYNFVFGKTKQRYKEKKQQLKSKLDFKD